MWTTPTISKKCWCSFFLTDGKVGRDKGPGCIPLSLPAHRRSAAQQGNPGNCVCGHWSCLVRLELYGINSAGVMAIGTLL